MRTGCADASPRRTNVKRTAKRIMMVMESDEEN